MSTAEARLACRSHPPPAVRKVSSCGDNLCNGYGGDGPRDAAQRRRVQFADEMGLELTHVRVMHEPSWVPPQLPTRILSDLQPRRVATAAHSDHANNGHSSNELKSKFKCRFEQPITKYIVFRENIEKHCICLSSLSFEGCAINGVVSVKNVCFNKRVFAKVTYNSWKSSQEVPALYSSSSDGCAQDNFTFSFHCPAMTPFEFCLGFEAVDLDGRTFWDSNFGENYKVAVKRSGGKKLPPKVAEFTGSFKPSFDHVAEFSEYAAWQHHRSDKVYY